MSDEEIKRILIRITLDIAERYEDSDDLFQRILNETRNIE